MRTGLSGLRPYLLLGVLCLALYLPGLAGIPPVDRDEARFAQASRQMLETGDFVRIRFQDRPRHKKPAGTYWLQAASAALVGDPAAPAIWPYRLPSIAGAMIAVWLTFALGRTLFDPRTAFLAAALLAGSLLLVVEGHLAKADAVLLATVVAAQGALARVYLAAREGRRVGAGPALLFWAALGLGMLVKGPIAPLVAATTILGLKVSDRKTRLFRPLRPLVGVPLAALIFLPWLVAVNAATEGAFVADAVRSDLLPKLLSGQESHGFPPGYFLLLLTVTFWPGSLVAWQALLWAWRNRTDPALRFCLVWLLPAWLVFELVPTKLPHYVLPLYPALALLTARAAVGAGGELTAALATWHGRIARAAWAAVGLGLAGAVAALPWAVDRRLDPWALVPLLLVVPLGVVALRRTAGGRPAAALAVSLAAAVVLYGASFQGVFPRVDGIWPSRAIARLVAMRVRDRAPLAVAGYAEPSLVFLLGTKTRLATPEEAAAYLARRPGAHVLVSEAATPAFNAALAESEVEPQALGAARGFNYSKGRWVTVTLYGRSPRPGG